MFLNNGCAVVIDTIGGKPITHCTIGNHEYQDYAFDIKATLYVNPLYAIFAKNEGCVWFSLLPPRSNVAVKAKADSRGEQKRNGFLARVK